MFKVLHIILCFIAIIGGGIGAVMFAKESTAVAAIIFLSIALVGALSLPTPNHRSIKYKGDK